MAYLLSLSFSLSFFFVYLSSLSVFLMCLSSLSSPFSVPLSLSLSPFSAPNCYLPVCVSLSLSPFFAPNCSLSLFVCLSVCLCVSFRCVYLLCQCKYNFTSFWIIKKKLLHDETQTSSFKNSPHGNWRSENDKFEMKEGVDLSGCTAYTVRRSLKAVSK